MTPEECRQLIMEKRRQMDLLNFEIDEIAKQHIPDFHFLNHQVSTFWECIWSPIGVCVFNLDDHGRCQHCRYCQNPVERK